MGNNEIFVKAGVAEAQRVSENNKSALLTSSIMVYLQVCTLLIIS